MKTHVDDWKLVTFKSIDNIPKSIGFLQTQCKYTKVHCNDLEEYSGSFKICTRKLKTSQKNLLKVTESFESLAHLTGTHRRSRRGWFDGIGTVLKTVFGTMDSDDAVYYDNVINKVVEDDKELYRIMKSQVQVTQSAITNFNNTISKLNSNEKALNQNFLTMKKFVNDLNTNLSITDIRSIMNTHFGVIDGMIEDLTTEVNTIVEAILFAKQNVLHPKIISPTQIYTELTTNLKSLKTGKQFPLTLTVEDIHLLIDISPLNVFYVNSKLIFILNIPLVTPQEFELYHVYPLPVPHKFKDLTFALVQPSKRYLAITTNRQSYAQFNYLEQCKKLSPEHFICDGINEYSSHSNPSCESQLLTKILDSLPKECITKFMYGEVEIWQKLTNNRWIYIYSNPTKLTVDCPPKQITDFSLTNTGILSLDKDCKAYANLIQLMATGDIITNYTSPDINIDLVLDECCNDLKLNKTQHLFTPNNIGNIQLDDLNLASVKLHSIEEQITTQQEQNSKFNFKSGVHIPYLLYTICAFVLFYLLWRFCKIFQLFNLLRSSHNPGDGRGCCCVQIFNQCNTRRTNNRIEPAVEFHRVNRSDLISDDEDTPKPSPLIVKRTPSMESKAKYTYNMTN